jgi:hypothetical protein
MRTLNTALTVAAHLAGLPFTSAALAASQANPVIGAPVVERDPDPRPPARRAVVVDGINQL